MKIISQLFDVICFVIGPVMTVHYFLSDLVGRPWKFFLLSDNSKSGITIGIALIMIGILRVYWRKNKGP